MRGHGAMHWPYARAYDVRTVLALVGSAYSALIIVRDSSVISRTTRGYALLYAGNG